MIHISKVATSSVVIMLMSIPNRGKIIKAELKTLLLQLLGMGLADRLFSMLTPIHTISLIMATLLHSNNHVLLKPLLLHPTDTGEAEVGLVAFRHTPATHTPMQGIARRYHTTLLILRARTHSSTIMSIHLIWMTTGIIHISNKVSYLNCWYNVLPFLVKDSFNFAD